MKYYIDRENARIVLETEGKEVYTFEEFLQIFWKLLNLIIKSHRG